MHFLEDIAEANVENPCILRYLNIYLTFNEAILQ